jgi:uncharacterized protein (DUF433 family)
MLENLKQEIEQLKEQLNKLQNQLKHTDSAKALLKKKGYFVDNLWHVDDVLDDYDCTEEDAQEVLEMALTNEGTMEQIWLAIRYACEELEIERED